MGWDPELKLLAVGTKNGQIRVFGKPGVEIIGQLDKEDVSLVGIVWIPGESLQLCSLQSSCLMCDFSFLCRSWKVCEPQL